MMKCSRIFRRLGGIAAVLLILSCAAACGSNTGRAGTEPAATAAKAQDTDTGSTAAAQESTAAALSETAASPAADDTLAAETGAQAPSGAENAAAEEDSSPAVEETAPTPEQLKWEAFYALSAEEKDRYLQSFSDYKDFVSWMKEAQEVFRQEHPDILIGADGSFNLEDLLK